MQFVCACARFPKTGWRQQHKGDFKNPFAGTCTKQIKNKENNHLGYRHKSAEFQKNTMSQTNAENTCLNLTAFPNFYIK